MTRPPMERGPKLDRAYRRKSTLHRRARTDKRKVQLLYALETSNTVQARAKAAKLDIEIEPKRDLMGAWEILRQRIEQAILDDNPTIELEVPNALTLVVTHWEALGRKVRPRDKRTAELIISTAADEIGGDEYGRPGGRERVVKRTAGRLKGVPPKRSDRTIKNLIGRELTKRRGAVQD